MRKAGIFKIKALSNFREKIEEKLEKMDFCLNLFEKKLPLNKIVNPFFTQDFELRMAEPFANERKKIRFALGPSSPGA